MEEAIEFVKVLVRNDVLQPCDDGTLRLVLVCGVCVFVC
jgi:hypothetical protein